VPPFSVCPWQSMPFTHPCTTHAFFPNRLFYYGQKLRCNFYKICTQFHAVSVSGPSRNRIRPCTRLHTKERKNQSILPAALILYTDSQDMLVLSSTVASRYHNYCTDDSTSLGNYGCLLAIILFLNILPFFRSTVLSETAISSFSVLHILSANLRRQLSCVL
jgi:hypothetical protein